jgi:threonine/homoserine/homoserine lactone efflux protein
VIAFVLAVWALLLTPGPSNSLLALSGLRLGFVRSLKLIPVELFAYLLTVVPLSLLGKAALTAWPSGLVAAKLLAAVWVLTLAVRHWSPSATKRSASGASVYELFVTTLLNPKALIFGCVLLPQPQLADRYGASIALFAASVVGVALVWIAGASVIRSGAVRAGSNAAAHLQRIVAVGLAVLAAGLAGSALH